MWSLVSDPVDILWNSTWMISVFSPRSIWISLSVVVSINRDSHSSADKNVSFVKVHSTSCKKMENKKRNLAINNLLQVRDKTQQCSRKEKQKEKISSYWVLLYFAHFKSRPVAISCTDLSYAETPQTIKTKLFAFFSPLNENVSPILSSHEA